MNQIERLQFIREKCREECAASESFGPPQASWLWTIAEIGRIQFHSLYLESDCSCLSCETMRTILDAWEDME